VRRTILYRWRDTYRVKGAEAFPGRAGRPPKPAPGSSGARFQAAGDLAAAEKRIAELERKIGQQQVELDFFQRALRQVGASRPINGPAIPYQVQYFPIFVGSWQDWRADKFRDQSTRRCDTAGKTFRPPPCENRACRDYPASAFPMCRIM
jgi:transposase